jgi:hypothetical protein
MWRFSIRAYLANEVAIHLPASHPLPFHTCMYLAPQILDLQTQLEQRAQNELELAAALHRRRLRS